MLIKAVIFDLDGTITQPYLDFDVIREEIGLSKDAGPILEVMEKAEPVERKHVEEILHFHEEKAVAESTLNAGAGGTLDELRAAGIRIGILTVTDHVMELSSSQWIVTTMMTGQHHNVGATGMI